MRVLSTANKVLGSYPSRARRFSLMRCLSRRPPPLLASANNPAGATTIPLQSLLDNQPTAEKVTRLVRGILPRFISPVCVCFCSRVALSIPPPTTLVKSLFGCRRSPLCSRFRDCPSALLVRSSRLPALPRQILPRHMPSARRSSTPCTRHSPLMSRRRSPIAFLSALHLLCNPFRPGRSRGLPQLRARQNHTRD